MSRQNTKRPVRDGARTSLPGGDAGLLFIGTETLTYLVQQQGELVEMVPELRPIIKKWDAPHLRAELARDYQPYRADLTALVLAGLRKGLPVADAERLATATQDAKGAALLKCVLMTAPGEDGKPAWPTCMKKSGTSFDAATMTSAFRFEQAIAVPYGSDDVRWGLGTAVCAVADTVAATASGQHGELSAGLTFTDMTFGLSDKSEDCPTIRAGATKRWPHIVVIGQIRVTG